MKSPRRDRLSNEGRDPVEKSNVVLVAEDDNEIRDLVCTQLELDGFKVICVTSGDQAVKESRSLKPDVIVMDLKMPKMNGIEAIKTLKKDKGTRHIPIIVDGGRGKRRYCKELRSRGNILHLKTLLHAGIEGEDQFCSRIKEAL